MAQLVRGIEAEAILNKSSLKTGELVWLIDVIKFAVGTGLRLGELCSLHWSAVNLSDRRITVKVTEHFNTKSGHERSLPVRGEALRVLQCLANHRTSETDGFVFESRRKRIGDNSGLNPEYVSRRFKHFVRLSNMPDDACFHTLRHSYISWLVQDGVSIPVVKELAGHADIKTTMGYAHLSPDNLVAAVEQVFDPSPVP